MGPAVLQLRLRPHNKPTCCNSSPKVVVRSLGEERLCRTADLGPRAGGWVSQEKQVWSSNWWQSGVLKEWWGAQCNSNAWLTMDAVSWGEMKSRSLESLTYVRPRSLELPAPPAKTGDKGIFYQVRERTKFVFYKENWQCKNGVDYGRSIWKKFLYNDEDPKAWTGNWWEIQSVPPSVRLLARALAVRFSHCRGLDRLKPHRRGL